MPDSARAELRELLAYRGQLVAEIVARKSQLEHYQTAPLVARAERALMALRAERAALDQEIGRVICSDPALAEPCRLPTSAPGVGPILAATLLAELPELGRLAAGKVASLAGLAPVPKDSGERRGVRVIQGGPRRGAPGALHGGAERAQSQPRDLPPSTNAWWRAASRRKWRWWHACAGC